MSTSHDPNCAYCTKPETLKAVMMEVVELPASTVYLWKDSRYPGRCVVALKGHARELFALEPARRQQFMDEVSAVAAAIQQGFQADKINYAIFGDAVPHLHFHLVPKRKDGPEWGQPFVVNPSEPAPMSAEQIQACLNVLRARLGRLESAFTSSGVASVGLWKYKPDHATDQPSYLDHGWHPGHRGRNRPPAGGTRRGCRHRGPPRGRRSSTSPGPHPSLGRRCLLLDGGRGPARGGPPLRA